MNTLYWIDTGFACGGVIVNNYGVVIETAPIFSWMLKKKWEQVSIWNKIRKIEKCHT
jgi:hypothetical protein